MPKKRALLIGINEYPFLAKFAQLRGCLNDVALFRGILEGKFGFKSENIAELLNEDATRNNILDAMDELVDNCGKGDSIVFFFSGHGSRMKAAELNKSSGYYETIMPYDSGRRTFHPEAVDRDVADDEIYDWLMALGEKTSNITLIFDSCFASSIIRSEQGAGIKKGISPAADTPKEPLHRFNKSKTKNERKSRKKGDSGWLPLSEKYVLLSAAHEYEPANIYKQKIPKKQYGIFTYYLCEALREAKEGATYRDIWEHLYVRVKSRFGNQNPQLEGKRDRKLFGLREYPAFQFFSVTRRQSDRINLSGGDLHAVTKNSQWAIYPAGSKNINPNKDKALGKVKIISTNSQTSRAIIFEETKPDAIREGQRAIQVSYPNRKKPLWIWIENDVPELESQIEKLKDQLNSSLSLKTVADSDQADVLIRLRKVFHEQSEKSSNSARASSLIVPMWLVYGLDEQLLMPPRPVGKRSEISAVVENLEWVAKYHRTLSLKNPASVLNGKIDFHLLKQNDDFTWSEIVPSADNPGLVIHESERIAFRIINRFDAPIYFSILDMGLSKKVSLIYPPRGGHIMIGALDQSSTSAGSADATGILTIGQQRDARFKMFFPPNFPYVLPGTPEDSVAKEGLEIYKLFITTRPHDLSFLENEGVRVDDDSLTDENEIQSLIFDVSRGVEKEFGEETLSNLRHEWTVIEKPFVLRERL